MKKFFVAVSFLILAHGVLLAEQVGVDKTHTIFSLSAGYFGYSNVFIPNPLTVTLSNTNYHLEPFSYQLTLSGNSNGQPESVTWRVNMPQSLSMGLTFNPDGSKTYKAGHVSVSIREDCTNAAGHQTQTYDGILEYIQLSTKNVAPYPNSNQIRQRIFNPCGGHSDLANHIMNNEAVLQQVGNGVFPKVPEPVKAPVSDPTLE